MAVPDDDIPEEKVSYLSLLPVFMDIGFSLPASVLAAPFRGKKGAPTYRRAVMYSLLREIVSGFSITEGQKLSPSTDKAYRQIAKAHKWQPHTIDLANGSKGHWLGPSHARYVMLYLHGGGYISAATPGHLKYQFALQKAIRDQGHDFSVFSLSYTLVPKAVYPTQINQAVSALRYLVHDQKRDPETIIIAGDSAGGNLTAAVLSHLAHPHPKLAPLELSDPLLGALMISPWVSFHTTDDSFKRNASSDYLTTTALDRASNGYIGPRGRHDKYSEPVRAGPDWWAGVSNVVDQVMIWGGGGEILIDGIRRFQNNIKQGFDMAKYGGPTAASSIEKEAGGRSKTPTLQENGSVDRHGAPSPTGHSPKSHSPVPASPTATDKTPPFQTTSNEHGPDFTGLPQEQVDAEKRQVEGGSERVIYVETPRMAHEEMIIDHILRIGGKRDGAKVIESWLDSLLSESSIPEFRFEPFEAPVSFI